MISLTGRTQHYSRHAEMVFQFRDENPALLRLSRCSPLGA